MDKSKGRRSAPESDGVQGQAGSSRTSAVETLCTDSGPVPGACDDRPLVQGVDPSENNADEIRDAAVDARCEPGFSAFRGEERDRHDVFSRAVASALIGKRRRNGIIRARDMTDRPKCSHVLTVQELKFLLE